MIVTFYSYKGGVGRSMALANVAAWFRLQGLHVVMIDWDLEAPGLESFFATNSAERGLLRTRIGLVDLISTYKDVFPSLPKPPATVGNSGKEYDQFIQILDEVLPPIAHTLIPIQLEPGGTGTLSLLSAGCRSEGQFNSYAQTVQQFDWEEFYADYYGEAYFEWMRRQLLKPGVADVVLIDSRTGVAEMSGVCTRQLADVVVMLCAPNEQNLEGTAAMAKSFMRPDLLKARGGRSIELLPVPARVDVSEGRPVDLFEEQFRDKLSPFISASFRRIPASKNPLRLPYIREYAYAEQLAIGDAGGVKILQQAYVTLAAHLVALAGARSAIKQHCRSALRETFGLSTILVASLDSPSNTDFASNLCAQLDAAGIMAVNTVEKPEAALETVGVSPRAATSYGGLVLAVQYFKHNDIRLRDLWRRSRQLGINLAVAVEAGQSPKNENPHWSRRIKFYDVTKDFSELVNALQNPINFAPVPFMAPPVRPGFVGRSREIRQIKELLGATPAQIITSADTTVPTHIVAIVGLGGMGKTTLARAVCHDDDVIDKFDDGIVWMSLGGNADLLRAATAVLSAFGDDVSGNTNIDQAERRITAHLSNKRCLIIVDDVSDVSHLKLISSIGPEARAIITTRTSDIAAAIDATKLTLSPLSSNDARTLIARQGLSPETAALLTQKLDNQPLALELAEQILKRGVPAEDLIERIEVEGLTAIDTNSPDGSGSIFASLMLALEGLPQEDRLRLPMLAALPSSQPIDLATFANTNGLGVSYGEALAKRLAAISLIAFDSTNKTITISPLVHAFLRSLQLRQGRAEANRRSTSGAVKGVIGISYRREDSSGVAGRLYDRLTEQFGFDRVFLDVDGIEPGLDFVKEIERRIDESAAWLVIIGPNWTDLANERGERRLDNPSDFVRIEVATALMRGIPVIPVLVNGAAMPRREALPPELQGLVVRNALELKHSTFNQDVDRLIQALERLGGDQISSQRSVLADALPDQRRASSATISTGVTRSDSRDRGRRRMWATAAMAVILAAFAGLYIYYGLLGLPHSSPSPVPSPIVTPSSTKAAALFERADAYYFGRGVPQDYGKAAALYKEAAADGYAPAENALGRMYENGIGVEMDRGRAIEYYRRAALQGHPDAEAAIARLEPKAPK